MLLGLFLGAGTARASEPLPLLVAVPAPVRLATSAGSAVAAPPLQQTFRLHPEALRPGPRGLRQPGARLAGPSTAGPDRSLVVESVSVTGPDTFTCVGRWVGDADSRFVLAAAGETMTGTFTRPGQPTLRLQPLGGGLHQLEEVPLPPGDWCALGALPEVSVDAPEPVRDTGSPAVDPAQRQPRLAGVSAGAEDIPLLDFLVLYTERARVGAGGDEGIQSLIDYAVAENNLCYANSGIRARWNVVGREWVTYTDSGNVAADLLWLRDSPAVAALKQAYRADLVMLMVEYDRYGYAGIATTDAQGHGYTVFLRPWVASGLYVVPHEVGHLLGAGHDRLTCVQRLGRAGCGAYYPTFSYGHRFEVDGMTCRTVMAYEPGLGIPYFAGPEVRFRGVPTGVPEGTTNAADVVRTINLRAPVIARTLEPSCRFGFVEETAQAEEASGSVTLHIRRTGTTNAAASVECHSLAGTAAPGEDFAPFASRVTFPAGVTELAVTISLLDDSGSANAGEGDEYFDVLLRNPDAGTALSTRRQSRVTILDSQPWYRMAQAEVTVSESATTATVMVHRGGDLNAEARVPFAIRPGTAEPGQDFEAAEGTVSFPVSVREAHVSVRLHPDLAPEPDESLVVELGTPDRGAVVRTERTTTLTIADDDRDGAVDSGFEAANPLRPPTSLGSLLLRPDGTLLVTGVPSFRQSPALLLRRLLPDGTPDPTFREIEFLPASSLEPGTTAPAVLGLTVQSDGRILVAGEFAFVDGLPAANLVRLHPDGSRDESFAARPDSPCYSTAVLADGRVVVGGSFQRMNGLERLYLARLRADGELDQTFRVQANLDTIRIRGVALQADSKVVVCGTFWGFEGLARAYLARLNADGSLDRAFAARPDGIVSAVAVLPDQRILIAGGFTTPRLGLARLLPDGSTDPSFNPGSLFNAPVRHLAPMIDGRLMVGGAFTAAGPAAQNYLVRLLANGLPDLSFNPGRGPDDIVASVAVQPDGGVFVHGYYARMNQLDRAHLVRLRGPDLRLRLQAFALGANAGVRLQLAGFPGAGYVIEASENLASWSVVHRGTLGETDFIWDEHPQAGSVGRRFFRARVAP